MRFLTCGICGNEKSPLNESLRVDDVVYCQNCLKEKFPNEAGLKGKKIVHEFDPTICSSCSKDSGDSPLRRLGSYPICDSCEQALQAKIFPAWVKAFFAGVMLLVVFSLAWNWRFIEAYYQIKKTEDVLVSGSVNEAADLFAGISTNVPEISDFRQMANYYKGLRLLQEDHGVEALEAFRSCTALPRDYGIPALTIHAEISVSFNKKDYSGFVDAAHRYLSYDTSSIALAQMASAYACLYAEQKSDSVKRLAMEYLQKAISTQDTTRFFADYVNRIEHRLATHEIIDKEVFDARFPNGWTK